MKSSVYLLGGAADQSYNQVLVEKFQNQKKIVFVPPQPLLQFAATIK